MDEKSLKEFWFDFVYVDFMNGWGFKDVLK
jgi:hypothetical protein